MVFGKLKTTMKDYLIERTLLNEDIFSVDNTIKKYEKLLINAVIQFFKNE